MISRHKQTVPWAIGSERRNLGGWAVGRSAAVWVWLRCLGKKSLISGSVSCKSEEEVGQSRTSSPDDGWESRTTAGTTAGSPAHPPETRAGIVILGSQSKADHDAGTNPQPPAKHRQVRRGPWRRQSTGADECAAGPEECGEEAGRHRHYGPVGHAKSAVGQFQTDLRLPKAKFPEPSGAPSSLHQTRCHREGKDQPSLAREKQAARPGQATWRCRSLLFREGKLPACPAVTREKMIMCLCPNHSSFGIPTVSKLRNRRIQELKDFLFPPPPPPCCRLTIGSQMVL